MKTIDTDRLRLELARLNLTKRQLAERLGKPPSTLSTWLCGAAPAPLDLADRIERVLGLSPDTLSARRGPIK